MTALHERVASPSRTSASDRERRAVPIAGLVLVAVATAFLSQVVSPACFFFAAFYFI